LNSPLYPSPQVLRVNGFPVARISAVHEQILQLDDFAQSIKENHASPVTGEMGRQEVRIFQAIYQSYRSNGNHVEVMF
jgi:hypothetical protein